MGIQHITRTTDNGEITGYQVQGKVAQLQYWFVKRGIIAPDLDYDRVAFIDSLYVDPDSRGNGEGNELMNAFIDADDDSDCIILECDTGEDNAFNLKEWYEGFGFEVLIDSEYPIMILS